MNIYSKNNPPIGFYVYAYIRARTSSQGREGTPYYIGKGSGKRAWMKHTDRIKPPKDTNLIIILESNLSEIGAFAIERRIIKWHGRLDLGTGILRNQQDGGEGATGAKFFRSSAKAQIPAIEISTGKKIHVCSVDPRFKSGEIVGINKGKTQTLDHRRKNSEGVSALKWWNDGVSSFRSRECPGPQWTRGRGKVRW